MAWHINTGSINPAKWTYKLVKGVVRDLGWQEIRLTEHGPGDMALAFSTWALNWGLPRMVNRNGAVGLGDAWLNRFPGTADICEKRNFELLVKRAKKLSLGNFSSVPDALVLPDDSIELQSILEQAGGRKVFIVKPGDGSGGRCIFLARTCEELEVGLTAMAERTHSAVAQKYVERSLLCNGLKFDMRLFVLLLGLNEPRVFLCRDGISRFATKPYTGTSERELNAHLTNYALNRDHDNFVVSQSTNATDPKASKRPVSLVLEQLKSQTATSDRPFNDEALWDELMAMTRDVMALMVPILRARWGHRRLSKCSRFQIFGLDVTLDEDHKPWLVELNSSPSFRNDQTRPWDSTRDEISCTCPEFEGPHIHEHCFADVHVKRMALGSALQLVHQHHYEGQMPVVGCNSFGDPYTAYSEIDMCNNSFLCNLRPVEALWAHCNDGHPAVSKVPIESEQFHTRLATAWRELYGTALPDSDNLNLAQPLYSRSGSRRSRGPIPYERAPLEFFDFAELVFQLGSRQFSLDPATQATKIWKALGDAMHYGGRDCNSTPCEGLVTH